MQAGGYSHLKNGFNSSVDFFLVRGRLCFIPFVQLVVLIRGRFNSSVSTVSFIRRLKVFLLLFEFVHLGQNDFQSVEGGQKTVKARLYYSLRKESAGLAVAARRA